MPPSIRASATTDDSAVPEGPSLVARLLSHRGVVVGLMLFGLIVLAALTADWIAPHDPLRNNFRYRLGEPNHIHLLGTDRSKFHRKRSGLAWSATGAGYLSR